MTNKPQSDMPEVIYVNKHVEEVSEMFEEDPDVYKYISEQSHFAALADLKKEKELLELQLKMKAMPCAVCRKPNVPDSCSCDVADLEAKHREEMLGLLSDVKAYRLSKSGELTPYSNAVIETIDDVLDDIENIIKQRIGES